LCKVFHSGHHTHVGVEGWGTEPGTSWLHLGATGALLSALSGQTVEPVWTGEQSTVGGAVRGKQQWLQAAAIRHTSCLVWSSVMSENRT